MSGDPLTSPEKKRRRAEDGRLRRQQQREAGIGDSEDGFMVTRGSTSRKIIFGAVMQDNNLNAGTLEVNATTHEPNEPQHSLCPLPALPPPPSPQSPDKSYTWDFATLAAADELDTSLKAVSEASRRIAKLNAEAHWNKLLPTLLDSFLAAESHLNLHHSYPSLPQNVVHFGAVQCTKCSSDCQPRTLLCISRYGKPASYLNMSL